MTDWARALESAFQAHLKPGGSSGSTGSEARNHSSVNTMLRTLERTTPAGPVVPVVPDLGGSAIAGTTGTTTDEIPIQGVVPRKAGEHQSLSQAGTTGTTGTTPIEVAVRPTVLDAWLAGLASLNEIPVPDGFGHDEWRQLIHDGQLFMTTWGGRAAELGWTSLDLFGVHPLAPTARYDVMGLVPLIRSDEVASIDERSATTRSRNGSLLTYVRRPMKGAVLLWELGISQPVRRN